LPLAVFFSIRIKDLHSKINIFCLKIDKRVQEGSKVS